LPVACCLLPIACCLLPVLTPATSRQHFPTPAA
jgi:hypothetical protein